MYKLCERWKQCTLCFEMETLPSINEKDSPHPQKAHVVIFFALKYLRTSIRQEDQLVLNFFWLLVNLSQNISALFWEFLLLHLFTAAAIKQQSSGFSFLPSYNFNRNIKLGWVQYPFSCFALFSGCPLKMSLNWRFLDNSHNPMKYN